ncbi:MAG TPA: hypothetical protein PLO65_05050 [Caulobacter sp.]|nr:hypothetical protein [Caulobacter sp.]
MRTPFIVLTLAGAGLGLAACEPTGPRGIDAELLNQQVGRAVGDPNTCVLLVEKGSGKVVWRYGDHSTCASAMPSCQGAAMLSPDGLAQLAASGEVRTLSCDSAPDGASRVGWASGPVVPSAGAKYGDLAYAAAMEGPSVLPGREIKVRLEAAFRKAGM